jgi:hypothetical protein
MHKLLSLGANGAPTSSHIATETTYDAAKVKAGCQLAKNLKRKWVLKQRNGANLESLYNMFEKARERKSKQKVLTHAETRLVADQAWRYRTNKPYPKSLDDLRADQEHIIGASSLAHEGPPSSAGTQSPARSSQDEFADMNWEDYFA